MAIKVVTGWSPKGFEETGRKCVQTFMKHWPQEIAMQAFVNEAPNEPIGDPEDPTRLHVINRDVCDGLLMFQERHKDDEKKNGKGWGKPYNFRYDAVKFSCQAFYPEHAAALMPDNDILVWLDSDVISFKDVPPYLIEEMLDGYDLCYLGRGQKHSEIGFWACRISPDVHFFLEAFAHAYRSDEVFKMNEWHSAYVFDAVRRDCEKAWGLRTLDLTPGKTGHVWFDAPIGRYTDHLKGKRKLLGRSPERK